MLALSWAPGAPACLLPTAKWVQGGLRVRTLSRGEGCSVGDVSQLRSPGLRRVAGSPASTSLSVKWG